MQQVLKTLSPLLELRRAILTDEDLADWPQPIRQLFVDRKVLVRARPATHVTCDACYEEHVEEVNRVGGGKHPQFYVTCPESGWVEVPKSRLQQWTIDVNQFVSLLADAISGSRADDLVRGVAWKLGALDIGDDSFDVVFIRPVEQRFMGDWGQLVTRVVPARTVVISLGEIRDRPADAAAVLTLDAAFELTEAGIAFQAKRICSAITSRSADVGNVFRLRGELWQLTFKGKTEHLKDSVGMGYIARLLSEPYRAIPAVTLLAARAGIDPLVTTGSSGEVLDTQARDEYSRRYRELEEELREARENNDIGRIETLEGEMDQLRKELAAATGLGGRARVKTDVEKVRKSVRERISSDIKRINKSHTQLGAHLDRFIDTGSTCKYAPDRDPGWIT